MNPVFEQAEKMKSQAQSLDPSDFPALLSLNSSDAIRLAMLAIATQPQYLKNCIDQLGDKEVRSQLKVALADPVVFHALKHAGTWAEKAKASSPQALGIIIDALSHDTNPIQQPGDSRPRWLEREMAIQSLVSLEGMDVGDINDIIVKHPRVWELNDLVANHFSSFPESWDDLIEHGGAASKVENLYTFDFVSKMLPKKSQLRHWHEVVASAMNNLRMARDMSSARNVQGNPHKTIDLLLKQMSLDEFKGLTARDRMSLILAPAAISRHSFAGAMPELECATKNALNLFKESGISPLDFEKQLSVETGDRPAGLPVLTAVERMVYGDSGKKISPAIKALLRKEIFEGQAWKKDVSSDSPSI